MTPWAVFPKCGSCERPSARTRYRFSDTEAGGGWRELDAVDELDAGPRILGEQEVAVQVDVIAEARNLAAGGDAEAGLDHAAQHHAEAERPRGVCHPHGLADPTRLRELDVDAVRALGARGDVRERVAVLVDIDRKRRFLLQLRAGRIARLQRLLDVLHAGLGQLRDRLERFLVRPVLVHVHLKRHVGDAAYRADALHVEAVAPAELQLHLFDPAANASRPPRHVVWIAEPDRPRGRRPGAAQSE